MTDNLPWDMVRRLCCLSTVCIAAICIGVTLLCCGCQGTKPASNASMSVTTGKLASNDPDMLRILNDGTTAGISMVFRPETSHSPEMLIGLEIWRAAHGGTKVVCRRKIGIGLSGTLEVGHLTGGPSVEVFVSTSGQRTYAEVLRFNGTKKPAVLYRLDEGRPYVYLQYANDEGGCKAAEVVEQWPVWQLDLENDNEFKAHKYARRIFRWNGQRYQLNRIEPSNGDLPCDPSGGSQ